MPIDFTAPFNNALDRFMDVDNRAAAVRNALAQQQYNRQRQAQEDQLRQQELAMRQDEYGMRQQELMARNALIQQQRMDQEEQKRNALAMDKTVGVLMDEGIGAGDAQSAFAPYGVAGQEMFKKMYPEPEDPYKSLPGDLRARMMAEKDPRIAAALQAEDERKVRQARAGAPSVSVTTGEKGFKHERELRNDFRSEPAVKEYNIVSRQSGMLDAAYQEYKQNANKPGSNVAVDQTLITVFNRMLDPDSTVREAEYARTSQDIALLNRIKGKWDKILKGGAGLTGEEREAMVRMAKRFSFVSKKKYEDTRKEYARTAQKWEFDPSYVVGEDQPRQIMRTGMANGRKVVEYDDGSIEYAD